MKNITATLLLVFVTVLQLHAQQVEVYPSNWWVGMKNQHLQLMLHGNNIGKATGFTIAYPGVQLKTVTKSKNANYVFLDLLIAASAKPGTIAVKVAGMPGLPVINYPLQARRPGKSTAFAQGVTSADFIYFLMPDRFSNGDESNDRIPGLRDQSLNRDSIFLRHGGDMQGITNHLDYLQSLGATALWMTPVLENDMPDRTEHGYAFTNHYKIESRFGGDAGLFTTER